MHTLELILISVAWAALAFLVIRALVIMWGFHRRFATATAFAVAGAFVLGVISPYALRSQPPPPLPPVPPAPAAAPAPVAVAPARAVDCPSGVKLGKEAGTGYVDRATVAGAPAVLTSVVSVPAAAPIEVDGWAVSSAGPAKNLCLVVDGKPFGTFSARYGIDRPDVAAALKNPADRAVGYAIRFRLPSGPHTVEVGVVEPNGTLAAIHMPLKLRVQH